MKISILGSAAYERVPALFCHCPVCEQAKLLGGRNLRTQAQTVIDGELLVDFNQDNYQHFLFGKFDFSKVNNVIITHAHSDHFIPKDFCMTAPPYGHNDIDIISIFGSNECGEFFKDNCKEKTKCKYYAVVPYQSFKVGKYTVTALPADHGTEEPMCYVIFDGKKTLLYNNDTGLFAEEVYRFLAQKAFKIDAVIADCTMGFYPNASGRGHMSFENNLTHKKRLTDIGIIDQSTKYIINHFSHNGLIKDGVPLTAEDLEKLARDNGFISAYDGFTIEI